MFPNQVNNGLSVKASCDYAKAYLERKKIRF